MFLQTAGEAMVATGNAYDVTRYEWLTTSTETGKFLSAMTGWDPRPSWLQVVAWAHLPGRRDRAVPSAACA
jgi:hypothetical protein